MKLVASGWPYTNGTYTVKGVNSSGIQNGDLNIDWIKDAQCGFHLSVNNHAGYEGKVSGIATFIDKNTAVYDGENSCRLIFYFEGPYIRVEEQLCSYYHGANILFSGIYNK